MRTITLLFLSLALLNGAELDLLSRVQAYADAMIAHGRDTYGSQHSPLFAVTLDRQTGLLPTGATAERIRGLTRQEWGVRSHDRILTGANPGQDQSLLTICTALSELTGDERYAAEAEASLAFFLAHCQGPTGLFCWGEHCGWDFLTESRATQDHREDGTHEFCNNWERWSQCFAIDPAASARFATGLWEHQISDQQTGNFSRHAKIDHHAPGSDSQYPRHGGFYIRCWAEAYAATGDPTYLTAITVLVDSFQGRRHPQTRALLGETHKRGKGDSLWASSSLTLAIELTKAAPLVPDDLAAKLLACAHETDAVYTRLAHEPAGRGGYVGNARASTLEPIVMHKPSKSPYSSLWTMAYGASNSADPAYRCLLRSEQTGDERYRALGLAGAERYLSGTIAEDQVLWPATFANLIGLQITAYRITGDERYRQRADEMAAAAIRLFCDDTSPLPKASNRHDHYEAITGGPLLMLALLDLHCLHNDITLREPLAYDNR